MALVNDFVPEFAHVADSHSDESDCRTFMEGELFESFRNLLLELRLLLLGWLIY